jgi:hypothetical protein
MNISRASWAAAGMALILFLGIAAVPAIAHHSFAMYDTSLEKTVTGKLIRFVVGANHSQYILQVMKPDGSFELDEKGNPVTWTVETTAAAALVRKNITVDTFKYGTVFTITFSPLRDGRNGGAQTSAGLIMCGMKMPAGGCNEKTGKTY